jgi:hypothetical protein
MLAGLAHTANNLHMHYLSVNLLNNQLFLQGLLRKRVPSYFFEIFRLAIQVQENSLSDDERPALEHNGLVERVIYLRGEAPTHQTHLSIHLLLFYEH